MRNILTQISKIRAILEDPRATLEDLRSSSQHSKSLLISHRRSSTISIELHIMLHTTSRT
jgi:hypothetical protein